MSVVDPEVADVAQNQNIVVSGSDSILRSAAQRCCTDITARFQNFSGYLMSPGSSANHAAAVMNTYSTAVARPRLRVNQVVALGPDPAKHWVSTWMKFRALQDFYRAAFRRKLDDRFEKKMKMYKEETQSAWDILENTGLPVVLEPIPRPGAYREYNPGLWSAPTAAGSGSTDPGSRWDVSITWVGTSSNLPSNTPNNESAGADTQNVVTQSGQVVSVSIAGLNPPSGMPPIGTADGTYSPLPAAGWNVYIGPQGGTLWLQNASPIAIGTTSYTLPNAPVIGSTAPLGMGQFADYNYAFVRVLQRA